MILTSVFVGDCFKQLAEFAKNRHHARRSTEPVQQTLCAVDLFWPDTIKHVNVFANHFIKQFSQLASATLCRFLTLTAFRKHYNVLIECHPRHAIPSAHQPGIVGDSTGKGNFFER